MTDDIVTDKLSELDLVNAIHAVVALGVRETLKDAAPGLAEAGRNAIAISLAIKLSRKVAALAHSEIARLRAALLTCPCPGGGYTGIPANTEPTVGACIAAGVCGCIYGDAMK